MKSVAIIIIGAVCLIIGIGLAVAIYPNGGLGLGDLILPIALIIVGIFLICWGVKEKRKDKIKVGKS